jgi:hypothetical protein
VAKLSQKDVVDRCCLSVGITEEQKSALSLQMWRESFGYYGAPDNSPI